MPKISILWTNFKNVFFLFGQLLRCHGMPLTSFKSKNFRKLTRLRVALSELPANVMTEVVAYTWNQFLSDIGGSAGLILGISAFTIFTNIEGTASRFWSYWKRPRNIKNMPKIVILSKAWRVTRQKYYEMHARRPNSGFVKRCSRITRNSA